MSNSNFAKWTPNGACSSCGGKAPSPDQLPTLCPHCYCIMSGWTIKPTTPYETIEK